MCSARSEDFLMRDGFRDAISGWTLIDDVDAIGEKIEAAAAFAKQHGPLEPDEQRAVSMMVEAQVLCGIRWGHFEPYIGADQVEDVAEHFRLTRKGRN